MPIYKDKGKKDGYQKYKVRINYSDANGNHKQLTRIAYGLENAKELERVLTYELKSGRTPDNRMTLKDLYDDYIKAKELEVRGSSMRTMKGKLTVHVLPYLGNVYINNLKPKLFQDWKHKIDALEDVKSVRYKQEIYAALNSMLMYAVRMEYIPRNPLTNVGNFRDAYISKKNDFQFYTPEEFHKFIAVAFDLAEKATTDIYEWNFYVFFNIAFYTGMRKGEICALHWTDLYDNTIHITRSLSWRNNGLETAPKTKSSFRNIQCPLPLKKVLEQHKERCMALNGYSDDWYICGGAEFLRESTIDAHNRKYAAAAEVKQIRIHDFRHSHASVLANNGINIQEIAHRLGHGDVKVTWNIYSHLYPKEEERALNVLDKL